MNPEISIITIVYNGLPFLKECVDSVLAQKFENWELLISDDGSTDGSRDYIDSLHDSRIKIFKQANNLGIFGNLNFLFEQARSPITQILCQDDYFTSPNSIDLILSYWTTAAQSLGFVRFNHQFERSRNLVTYEKSVVPPVIKAGEADIWFYIFGNIPGNLSNVSLRTEIVQKCGLFNQELPFAGDFDFWSRAARVYDMGVEKGLVVHVRKHKQQASVYLNFNGELISQKIRVINEIFGSVKQTGINMFLLKLHGTLNYDSLQRYIAVKYGLKGSSKYFNELTKWADKATYTFGFLGRWIFFFLSLGGRVGRIQTAKKIIEKYYAGYMEKG